MHLPTLLGHIKVGNGAPVTVSLVILKSAAVPPGLKGMSMSSGFTPTPSNVDNMFACVPLQTDVGLELSTSLVGQEQTGLFVVLWQLFGQRVVLEQLLAMKLRIKIPYMEM